MEFLLKVLGYALLFVLGLALYALAYMLAPLMVCKRKKPLANLQIVKILLVNGPVAWVALSALAGDTRGIIVSGVMMLIFSVIDYFIMEKQSRLAKDNKMKYVPRYRSETRVQLVGKENETCGSSLHRLSNARPQDLVLQKGEGYKEGKVDEKLGISDNRKQLVNLAMNLPEDKIAMAIKLLRTIDE